MSSLFDLSQFSDLGLLFLRLTLASIFLAHGLSKWGLWSMKPSKEMPAKLLGLLKLAFLLETIGGLLVLLGFYTTIGTIALIVVMLGATYFKAIVWKVSFMEKEKMGWEFDLILLAASLLLFLMGPGRFSIEFLFLGAR